MQIGINIGSILRIETICKRQHLIVAECSDFRKPQEQYNQYENIPLPHGTRLGLQPMFHRHRPFEDPSKYCHPKAYIELT
jgi:hypothetical protein